MELKKCPYCGKAVLAASKSCKHCGKSFASQTEDAKERRIESEKMPAEQPFVEQQKTEIQQNIVDAPVPPEQTEKAGIKTTCWMWLLCTILLIASPILGILGVIGLIVAANYKRIQNLVNQR
jgi:hypothetical protein